MEMFCSRPYRPAWPDTEQVHFPIRPSAIASLAYRWRLSRSKLTEYRAENVFTAESAHVAAFLAYHYLRFADIAATNGISK